MSISTADTSVHVLGRPLYALKLPIRVWAFWDPSNTRFLWPIPSQHPERHHDRFSRFRTVHGRVRQTERQTTLLPSVAYRTQKIATNSPSAHHQTTLSGYIFATKARIDNWKKLLNSNISPTCPRNMVNFGPLAAEVGLPVWGTPANFNVFRVLASILQRRRSTEANQTLHNVWPSPGLVHYIYIFGSSCPLTELCQVQNSLCVQVLRSPILAALLHGTRVVGVSQTLRR